MPERGFPPTPFPQARRGISNQYVFAKVMYDNTDLCREVVEAALGIKIARLENVEVEGARPQIDKRSVRFDVLVEGDGTVFEMEMQACSERHLPQRMRYYHSQVDRVSLAKGASLGDLRPVYVIFICTYDPFGCGLPVYTFRNACVENPAVEFDDGATSVALNAAGDLALASEAAADLLQYVATGRVGEGALSARLDRAVDEAYRDEEWVSGMMSIEWEMENVRRAAEERGRAEGASRGRAEGKAAGLSEGAAAEGARIAALATAMLQAGCTGDDVAAAVCLPDKTDLYRRYLEPALA